MGNKVTQQHNFRNEAANSTSTATTVQPHSPELEAEMKRLQNQSNGYMNENNQKVSLFSCCLPKAGGSPESVESTTTINEKPTPIEMNENDNLNEYNETIVNTNTNDDHIIYENNEVQSGTSPVMITMIPDSRDSDSGSASIEHGGFGAMKKKVNAKAVNDEDFRQSLQYIQKKLALNTDHLDNIVVDTTQAFLELLQLDTMSKHLQEMRQRRMFLEKAANDLTIPEEEREIAAWITDTYLTNRKAQNIYNNMSPTTNANNANATYDLIPEKPNNNEKQVNALLCKIDKHLASPQVTKVLALVDQWDFNVFEFVNLCDTNSLSILMLTICQRRGLLSSGSLLGINDKLIKFMRLIDENYENSNPYHNHIHACDVTVSMHYFMKSSMFDRVKALDKFAILISASVHDVGHPGHNNTFEISTGSELAITYNDASVLENMHIARTWRLLQSSDECNILSNMTKEEKKRFRFVLIRSVLATDMNQHSLHSETLDKLVDNYDTIMANSNDQYCEWTEQFLPIALHTADLGNPAKPIEFYSEWVLRVMKEFFNQGDKERKLDLPISMLCDRFKVNIHAGQVGFINYVIRPWFDKFSKLMDVFGPDFLVILQKNFAYMQERANETKDAQDEIKKNDDQKSEENDEPPMPESVKENELDSGNTGNTDNIDDQEAKDQENDYKTSPDTEVVQPIVYPIPSQLQSRTSKSYSIVNMSLADIKRRLKDYKETEL